MVRLWEYRDLLYFLIWRDIKVRYKQTFFGASWAIIKPFLAMLIFSIFFGKLAKMPSDDFPYPIFAYTALLPWQLFSQILNYSGTCLVNNQQLITKVYFPRLIVPIATVGAGIVDFFFACLALLVMLFYYHIPATSNLCLLPVLVLMVIFTALGAGIWISSLDVLYRDARHIMPFLLQIWFFISPIIYPASLIPARWRFIYNLNPMVGIIEGFRWSVLGGGRYPFTSLFISGVVILAILISGMFFFRRVERIFADII